MQSPDLDSRHRRPTSDLELQQGQRQRCSEGGMKGGGEGQYLTAGQGRRPKKIIDLCN